MSEKRYSPADIWTVREEPATEKFREHARIAEALRKLTDSLIRVDTDTATLSRHADVLEAMAEDVAARPHLSHRGLFDRLRKGEATREDCEQIFDFEIMVGRAAAVAPPMTLWVEGEVAQARVMLNHVFQGPPGRVHGGVIALMMDILLARVQEITGTLGFTGYLNIRYHAATPLDTELEMDARILKREGRKMLVEGRIFANGVHTVTAEGLWITANKNMF